MMEDERLYEPVAHVFSDEEIRRLGEALARETQNLYDLRNQKSIALAALASQMKASEKAIGELTTKITNRYETVDVEVMWMPDNPKPGTKALVCVNNMHEVIRYAPMTPQEQGTFGFTSEEEK